MTCGKLTMLKVVVLALALLLSPCLAAAEPYGGAFVGAALSHDTDIDQKLSHATFKDVELNTSVGATSGTEDRAGGLPRRSTSCHDRRPWGGGHGRSR